MKSIAIAGTILLAPFVFAAESLPGDKVNVPLKDPSRPLTLKANLINGNIHVKGYSGKEVIVEARSRGRESAKPAEREGMRRLTMRATGLEVEEDNNVVRVTAAAHSQPVDLEIQVPSRASIQLKTINNGDVVVEGIQGDVDVSNINGPVTLTGISGSAVAHALNGKIKAVFTQVDSLKPMSFSSLNGEIDLTFPASLKANVKLKNRNGEIYTDFDVKVGAAEKPAVEEPTGDKGKDKGKYKVKFDSTINGTINGGGAEIQVSNFNGTILLRKAGQ